MEWVIEMPSYNEFYNLVVGKGFDIDHSFGNQCWDGYAKYCQYLGIPIEHCTQSGYVKDIWNLRKTNGILNVCDEVHVMQQGDIAVFKEVPEWTPKSHIAIFHADIDGTYGWFLGQNQGAYNGVFNLVKLPYYATFDTAFRPKVLSSQSSGVDITNPTVPDDILSIGSKVQFKGLLSVDKWSESLGMIYSKRLGGWLSPSICYEDSDRDGAQDQFFATTNATFTIQGTYTVSDLRKVAGVWQAFIKELNFWVKAEPLIEVQNGM